MNAVENMLETLPTPHRKLRGKRCKTVAKIYTKKNYDLQDSDVVVEEVNLNDYPNFDTLQNSQIIKKENEPFRTLPNIRR